MNSMKIQEQDEGNGEVVRLHGEEAGVKSVSPGTRTCYQAAGVDERAAYREGRSSAPEVKHGVVRRSITFLPGEASSPTLTWASLRGLIPVDGDEESAEVIVVFNQPGLLTEPRKRRDRKSG